MENICMSEASTINSLESVRVHLDTISEQIAIRFKRNGQTTSRAQLLSNSEIRSLLFLSSKSKMASTCTDFFVRLIECFQLSEKMLRIRKEKINELAKMNRILSANINYYIEKINEAECLLAGSEEETAFWKMFCSLDRLDYDAELERDDNVCIWGSSSSHDSLWSLETALSLEQNTGALFTRLMKGDVSEIEHQLCKLVLADPTEAATYACVLEQISRELYFNFKLAESELILRKALEIRKMAYGLAHPIVGSTLVCLAVINGALKNTDKATELAFEGYSLLNKTRDCEANAISSAQTAKCVGQKLVSWGHAKDGLKLIKKAISLLHRNLPYCETSWMDVCARLVRICNDTGLHQEAMLVACDVVDYFHEKFHGIRSNTLPTIVEFAYTYQVMRTTPSIDTFPPFYPVPLNRFLKDLLKEIGVAFANKMEFKASTLMLQYLKISEASLPFDYNTLNNLPINESLLTPEFLPEQNKSKKEKKSRVELFSKLFKRKG